MHQRTFKISNLTIWVCSLFIGILASIPKIFRVHIAHAELAIDVAISTTFSAAMWYYHIFNLPKFRASNAPVRFASKHLAGALALGTVLIIALIAIPGVLVPQYHYFNMIWTYELRAVIMNMTIYVFLYIIYQNFITQAMSVELEKTKADNLSAQFELLKQQVNPHFLFNSLNTLKAMVEIGDKNAARFIVMLSDFYRFALEKKRNNLISLSEETETLHAYMFLLQSRFEEGIRLEMQISEPHRRSVIPPFTMQLLIENCIKHNVVSLDQPLHIRIYSEQDCIVVENNLQLKRSAESSTGTGLHNIAMRYLPVMQKKIEIVKEEQFFKVKLPVIYEDSHY